jgi:hypothetical protein
MQESWQHLLRDRASRTLTYNDEQFHILEKIKMGETIRVIVDILTKVNTIIASLKVPVTYGNFMNKNRFAAETEGLEAHCCTFRPDPDSSVTVDPYSNATVEAEVFKFFMFS